MNGEVVWADLFASTQLLQKYWPKRVRSYATEAVVTRAKSAEASPRQAQKFLDDLQGRHETADTEPGVYRQTEISGNGFRVFELTSLLPKYGIPGARGKDGGVRSNTETVVLSQAKDLRFRGPKRKQVLRS